MELAFFGGNFLGLSPEQIVFFLDIVKPYVDSGQIHGIRFSTRPDTISSERLELIRPYPVSVIELGVQSMTDKVLVDSKRGHTAEDTVSAISLIKNAGYVSGVQLMVGLPGETRDSLLLSTTRVAQLRPDIARIYPLLVLKGSLMARWYQTGAYQPLTLEESVGLTQEMVQVLEHYGVRVIRLGLQSSDMMDDKDMVLAGPWHPAFGQLVASSMMRDEICRQIKGDSILMASQNISLKIHPHTESILRGNRNSNFETLKNHFPQIRFSIIKDIRRPQGQVLVQLDPSPEP